MLTGPQPSAVRFADATHGWLGLEDGILGTTDGGASWDRELTAGRVTRIWSYDATRAWALAADNTVYRTRDGAHWTAIPPTTPPIAAIDPFGADVLWAIGVTPTTSVSGPLRQTGNVLASTDGGFIWRPVGTHTMWSVCFDSPLNGFGAEGNHIFRTVDAGRSWTAVATLTINDQGPWYPTLTCPTATSFRVQVTEPYAALSHVPYLVFRTTDAGRNWILEYREGYTLGTTTAPATPGLGSYPSIIGPLPDGDTWVMTCSPPAEVQGFLILDPAGGVVTQQKAPFVACARDATFVDPLHGWAVATDYSTTAVTGTSRGIVMRTTDGSRTWSRVYP
jgi:photosystem II stability/assembly factor-like uncharacterized protein